MFIQGYVGIKYSLQLALEIRLSKGQQWQANAMMRIGAFGLQQYSTMLIQEKYTRRLMENNLRSDGREPFQPRDHSARFLPRSGHLVFRIGATETVIKTRVEITAPKAERPNEGIVFFRVDCQSCQGSIEENRKLAAETGKLLETVIVGSKALDPESLCILSGRYVWKVAVEASVIVDEGNVVDCVLNGAVLALLDVRKPFVRLQEAEVTLDEQVQQPLSLAHLPLSFTFGLTNDNIFADPSAAEDQIALSRLTVSMNVYREICSIHKPGGAGISEDSLANCLRVVELQVQKMNGWLRETAKTRPLIEELL